MPGLVTPRNDWYDALTAAHQEIEVQRRKIEQLEKYIADRIEPRRLGPDVPELPPIELLGEWLDTRPRRRPTRGPRACARDACRLPAQ